MYAFRTIKYGKRPSTIYITKTEYEEVKPNEQIFQVYHATINGDFYIGTYRHKKTIKDIIILRRTLY